MPDNYKFFENPKCEYYPCHKTDQPLNCLFCYCPLYTYSSCPGTPAYIDTGSKTIKDCSGCVFPHNRDNYDIIINILMGK